MISRRRHRQGKAESATVLAVSKRFGRYKKEERKEVREAEVKKGPISQLMERWEEYSRIMGKPLSIEYATMKEGYDRAIRAIGGVCFSPKDVEEFSVAFASVFENDDFASQYWAGLFFSAIINSRKDDIYCLKPNILKDQSFHLEAVQKVLRNYNSIRYFGFRNSKNLIIDGNLGEEIGVEMLSGNLLVRGHCHSDIGRYMENGTITVKGDVFSGVGKGMKGGCVYIMGRCGPHVGTDMEGGIILIGNGIEHYESISPYGPDGVGLQMKRGCIYVKGDVRAAVGCGMTGGVIFICGSFLDRFNGLGHTMTGGEIHVEGDISSIGNVIHGKIYHKGKLIVDK